MDGESRFRKIKLSSNGKAINTVIGRGSVSEGRFRIETGVRVDGVLKGELVSSGTLIVGESGVIEADVRVREALVSGRIVGDLIAEEKVHLQSQATFIGKIKNIRLQQYRDQFEPFVQPFRILAMASDGQDGVSRFSILVTIE